MAVAFRRYIKDTIKHILLRYFPSSIVNSFKRIYHLKTLKSLSDDYEKEFKVVKYLVANGDNVIDVGANFGIYSKFLSDLVGDSGTVYSFEPIPITYRNLQSNISKLRLKNIKVMNYAISDRNGYTSMGIPISDDGIENYYMARIFEDGSDNKNETLQKVEVECKSLDSLLFDENRDISFIKCDVEGHEFQCIQGAKKIIERSFPAWLVEIAGDPDNPDSTAHDLFEFMRNYGYQIYWFDEIKLKKRRKGDKVINYFFLTDKQLTLLEKTNLL